MEAKRALAQALDRLGEQYRIEVQELDLLDNLDLAARHGIMATPAVLIDDELAFAGRIKETDLREKLESIARRDA